MTVETGAIVTNFVANTGSFERGTRRAAQSAGNLRSEAVSAASSVAGAFGLQSPAVAAVGNMAGQLIRAAEAGRSMTTVFTGVGGFAAIGLAIGGLVHNFRALGTEVENVNKLIEDGTVKGVPLTSVWREIGETYGFVRKEAWDLRMEVETGAEYQARMAKQRKELMDAERKDWDDVQKAQQLVIDRQKELDRAMRDRPRTVTNQEDIDALKQLSNNMRFAQETAAAFGPGEYENYMADIRNQVNAIRARGTPQNNAETDRARQLLEIAEFARADAEAAKSAAEGVEFAKEQAAAIKKVADAWNEAREAEIKYNDANEDAREQTRKTNEEWLKYYQDQANERMAKDKAMQSNLFERPAAVEKGTVADYRANLSNQDAIANTQKNIEALNKRMAASLSQIEKDLKVTSVGID